MASTSASDVERTGACLASRAPVTALRQAKLLNRQTVRPVAEPSTALPHCLRFILAQRQFSNYLLAAICRLCHLHRCSLNAEQIFSSIVVCLQKYCSYSRHVCEKVSATAAYLHCHISFVLSAFGSTTVVVSMLQPAAGADHSFLAAEQVRKSPTKTYTTSSRPHFPNSPAATAMAQCSKARTSSATL